MQSPRMAKGPLLLLSIPNCFWQRRLAAPGGLCRRPPRFPPPAAARPSPERGCVAETSRSTSAHRAAFNLSSTSCLAKLLRLIPLRGTQSRFVEKSGRRRGCPRRPPTPPDIRFRIRRFSVRLVSKTIALLSAVRSNQAAGSSPQETPRSCDWPRSSTTARVRSLRSPAHVRP